MVAQFFSKISTKKLFFNSISGRIFGTLAAICAILSSPSKILAQAQMLTVTMATSSGVTSATMPVRVRNISPSSDKTKSLPGIKNATKSASKQDVLSPQASTPKLPVSKEILAAREALERVSKDSHIERAQSLFALLRLKDYETIVQQFDTIYLKASPKLVAKQWEKVAEAAGEFKSVKETSSEPYASGDMVTIEADHSKIPLEIKFSFTEKHLLNGLGFSPARAKYQFPKYAHLDSTEERNITIKTGEYSLPGILTLPKYRSANTRLPIAILLHGAGAEDKDRTSGPLKPNKDLALGLAAQGIASIRYEKRTKLYALQSNEYQRFTVKEEFIEDAVSAMETARSLAQETSLDVKKIIILAPNLAGSLVSRINDFDAQKNPTASRLAGAILIAPNHSKWLETVRTRFKRAFMLDNTMTPEESRVIATLEREIAVTESDTLSPTTPLDKLPFNIGGAYWLDLRAYNHVQALTNAPFPLFFIHGEHDRYMSFAEFNAWKETLGKKGTTTFKSYPGVLNLLVMRSDYSSTDEPPGNVEEVVVRDIIDWIRKL